MKSQLIAALMLTSVVACKSPVANRPASMTPKSSNCPPKSTTASATASSFKLFARSGSLWPQQNGKVPIQVCWMPFSGGRPYPVSSIAPDVPTVLALHKKWVQDVVVGQWNQLTGMNFTGWQECGEGQADVAIVPIDSSMTAPNSSTPGQPYVDALGADIRGKKVYLNMFFGDEALYSSRYQQMAPGSSYLSSNDLPNWFVPMACTADLSSPWSTNNTSSGNPHRVDINDTQQYAAFMAIYQSCLQTAVLHEFGHMLGFAHEQYRPDDEAKRQACAAAITARGIKDDFNNVATIYMGDKALGPFDAESIMSYCRTDNTPTLTQEDIQMTLALYGTTPTPMASTDPSSTPTNPGGNTAVNPYCL